MYALIAPFILEFWRILTTTCHYCILGVEG
jgi:hypothetical protein